MRRDRPASTSQVNEARVNDKTEVQKPDSDLIIPDGIPSHDNLASVEVLSAQMNKTAEEPTQDIISAPANVSTDKRERSISFTHSETEAVDILDEVLRDFDLDDNLNEISEPDELAKVKKPNSGKEIEPIYADSFSTGIPNDGVEESKGKVLSKGDLERQTKAFVYSEPVYAKPIKASKPTTPNENNEQNQHETNEGPAVPPKKFLTEEDKSNFSEVRKAPYDSPSQSREKTEWVNVNDQKVSPKRSSKQEIISTCDSKGGESSIAVPDLTSDDYKEPLPRYDANVNGTLSSIAKSTSISEDLTTRDNWTSSLTSNPTSGSPKVKKNIRPEVLDLIRERKSDQPKNDAKTSRQHDRLVKRSFRLMREASIKEDISTKTLENDYVAIKNEADAWFAKKERLRANSRDRNTDSAETISSSGSPQRTAGPESGSLKNEVISEDDEDLVRLMETGIFPKNTSSMVNRSQGSSSVYVPRALRMNFGQSWDGIRKDRRAWKSREINSMVTRNARKGPKTLSNRLDEQAKHLEMLF